MSYFKNAEFEYGIEFVCDCFPKNKFQEEVSGKRTELKATATFSNPIYSKILYVAARFCVDVMDGLLRFFRWLDGQTVTSEPKSEPDAL